ncbi:hypothetical protein H8959_019020 [Pygathrix nigripes]
MDLIFIRDNKDVCKRYASAQCPPQPSFAQQTLYLYKLFIAGLCKPAGAWEKDCFFTRVGGEGALFEGTEALVAGPGSLREAGGGQRKGKRAAGVRPAPPARGSSPFGCPAPFAPVLPPTWSSVRSDAMSDLALHLRVYRLRLPLPGPHFFRAYPRSSPAPPLRQPVLPHLSVPPPRTCPAPHCVSLPRPPALT